MSMHPLNHLSAI